MKQTTLRHGIYRNLPSGTVYNSQAGFIIFALGMLNLSSLPSVLSETYHSSTFWIFLLLTVVDVILTAAVFVFARRRYDDLLRVTSDKFYKLCCLIASFWFILKGVFYFSYSASYLVNEQFGGVEPTLFYILLLLPIIYIGLKGARAISRTAEIFVPIFFVLILLNLIFLDTDLDLGRNMPIFAVPPKEFFKNSFRYGLWLGDTLPFMFLRIKNKKFPYVSGGIAITAVIACTIILLGVSMYGNALVAVSDLLVRIAGFNQLSFDIGRMEWTNLFSVIGISIMSMSFLYFGCSAASERSTSFSLPFKILFPVTVAAVILAAPSSQAIAEFSVETVGYIMFAVAVFLPFACLIKGGIVRKKHAGLYTCLDDEYSPFPPEITAKPDSLADNMLFGMKDEEKDVQQIDTNGSITPKEENNETS